MAETEQQKAADTDRVHREAGWGYAKARETHWPASLAIVMAMVLYVLLPDNLTYVPKYIFPALEAALLLPLTFFGHHHRHAQERPWRRIMAVTLIALISAANFGSLALLLFNLLSGNAENGLKLISSGLIIWITNVIIFCLWYWELDRGGPGARCMTHHREPDFLFPQMANPDIARPHWTPSFVDYLYVSLTNATAFSPTDTMPLTAWAKSLMGIQSLASLLTIALVAGRAVNILH